MKLIIAEKPSLARAIVEGIKTTGEYFNFDNNKKCYIGSNYIVASALGHIFTLQNLDDYFDNNGEGKVAWSLNRLPFKPENNNFIYKLKPDITNFPCTTTFKILCSFINDPKVTEIISAGDPDEEGCLLILEIIEASKTTKPIKRLWLHDTTPETVVNELNNMKDNDYYKDYEIRGKARTYTDWIWGINGSRFLSIKTQTTLPIGRVKNCIIGEIYNREMEIKQFESQSYYGLESKCQTNGADIQLVSRYNTLKFNLSDKELEDKGVFYNDVGATVISIDSNDKSIKPKELFSQTTLQNYMSNHYKMKPIKVLNIVQALYMDHKCLTYPRTSETVMNITEQDRAKYIISQLNKEMGNEKLEFKFSNRIFQPVEAHSAITPTGKIPDYSKLSDDEMLVYNVVKNRFCAVFCKEDLIVSEQKMVIRIEGEEDFTKQAKVIKQRGWTEFEDYDLGSEVLPDLIVGDKVNINFKLKKKETSPKPRYTVEVLNNFMLAPFKKRKDSSESDGEIASEEEMTAEDIANIRASLSIGTDATRAGMLEECEKKGFIENKKNVYYITDKGIYLIEALMKLDIDYSAERTALLSADIAKIAKGEKTFDEVIDRTYREISDVIEKNRLTDFSKLELKKVCVGECPLCKGNVYECQKSYACEKGDFMLLKEPKTLFGKKVGVSLAKRFLKEKTVRITDLTNKEGKKFTANITMTPNEYKGKWYSYFSVDKETHLEGIEKCPICNGNIYEYTNTFSCENNDFLMVKQSKILGKRISKDLAVKFIRDKKVIINDLKSKDGNEYKAEVELVLNKVEDKYFAGFNINYNGIIVGRCPVCQGEVKEHKFAYVCEKNDFKMFKEDAILKYYGKGELTTSQASRLLEKKELTLTNCITKEKEKPFSKTVVLDYLVITNDNGSYVLGKCGFKKANKPAYPRPKPNMPHHIRVQNHELTK